MPPPTGQEFFKDFCEDETFIVQRRKVLRLRAGLTDAEKHKVGTLVFTIFYHPSTIIYHLKNHPSPTLWSGGSRPNVMRRVWPRSLASPGAPDGPRHPGAQWWSSVDLSDGKLR